MSAPGSPGVVNIRGKSYETVALRVHRFREAHPTWRLITSIIHRDDQCVVMQATIATEDGTVIATGHAEEYRKASEINRTSALENCETSAIGRALASLGLGGTEFASADEVARAVSGAKGDAGGVISGPAEAYKALSADWQAWVDDVAARAENTAQSSIAGAVALIDSAIDSEQLDDPGIKAAIWSKLSSKTRSAIKAHKQ